MDKMNPSGITGFVVGIMIAFCVVILPSCQSTPTAIKPHPPAVDVHEQVVLVGSVREAIDTQAASVKANAIGIKNQVNAGLSVTPDNPVLGVIGIKADTIEKSSDSILAESGKLEGVQEQLEKVKADFALLQQDFQDSQKMVKERDSVIAKANIAHAEALKKKDTYCADEIKKRDDELTKLKDSTTARLKMWLLIATLSFMGLAASAVGFGIYLGKPKLFVFAPVFIGCASLTYFCAQYLREILIFGGISFVGLIGYSIWHWKMEQDALKKNETALKEEVSVIEKVPDEVWAQIKQLWKDNVSPESQKLVELARVELKGKSGSNK